MTINKDAIFIDRGSSGEVIVNHELWSCSDLGPDDTAAKQADGWILIIRYPVSGQILWARPFGKK